MLKLFEIVKLVYKLYFIYKDIVYFDNLYYIIVYRVLRVFYFI